MVAVALAPERAEAHHICGHLFTTGSCPHPYAPQSRTDAYGFPVHPVHGFPVDDDGYVYMSMRQARRKVCQTVVPEWYPFVRDPRYGGGWSRCCNGRIRHIQDCCSPSTDPDQRRRLGPRLLSAEPARVLHHLPGAERDVLSEPLALAVVAASALSGLTALFGP